MAWSVRPGCSRATGIQLRGCIDSRQVEIDDANVRDASLGEAARQGGANHAATRDQNIHTLQNDKPFDTFSSTADIDAIGLVNQVGPVVPMQGKAPEELQHTAPKRE